jgi:hypothetical protein
MKMLISKSHCTDFEIDAELFFNHKNLGAVPAKT